LFPHKVGTNLVPEPGFRVPQAPRLVGIGKNMESFAVIGDYSQR
jgi:hypothetical protein